MLGNNWKMHNRAGDRLIIVRLTGMIGSLALLSASVFAQQSFPSPGPEAVIVPGLNNTETGMATVIRDACPSGRNEQEFQTRCNNLVGSAMAGQTGQVGNALQQAAPEQVMSQGDLSTRILQGEFVNFIGATIGARLSTLRTGMNSMDAVNTQIALLPKEWSRQGVFAPTGLTLTGGGASADDGLLSSKLGTFLNVNYNFGNIDSSTDQKGYDFNIGGITAGADYRFTNNFIVGAALSYLDASADFKNNAGNTDSRAVSGSIYSTYYATDNFYLDGVLSYGFINYDTRRKIRYTIAPFNGNPGETVNTTAKGSPDGRQYSFSLGGGYDYPTGAWTLGPYAYLNYTKLRVDSYRESRGAGWAMRFDQQDIESVISTLGAQVSYAVSTPQAVLLPQLWAEWRHEFQDDSRRIGARYLGDLTTGGQEFKIDTEEPDRNYFNVGLGLSATFAKGWSGFISYDSLLGYERTSNHQIMLGGRLEF